MRTGRTGRAFQKLATGVAVLALLSASAGPVLAESSWVQNHRPTTLWSGPDGQAIPFGTVPAWSGFELLGAQGERLLVRYLGNGVDHEGGVAWVDRGDLGPTERPILWVAARQPAALWSGPDEAAVLFGYAPEESLMVRVGPAAAGRAQVYFLGAGADQPPGLVWADLGSLRPAVGPPASSPLWPVWGEWEARVSAEARRLAAPPPSPPAARAAAPPAPQARASAPPLLSEEQKRFIDQVAAAARRLRGEVGLPPSLVVAIAINESGWGRSELATRAHNYFGIKAYRGAGTAGVVEMETWEVIEGRPVVVREPFRAYRSLDECLRDLASFLRTNRRYDPVWKQGNDPLGAARALHAGGYATDPAWVDKLSGLISRYELRKLDQP